jgi:hypothetical protein
MVPIGDLVGVSRQVAVLAFQFGDGFSNMIVPTNAILMGIWGSPGIPDDRWHRSLRSRPFWRGVYQSRRVKDVAQRLQCEIRLPEGDPADAESLGQLRLRQVCRHRHRIDCPSASAVSLVLARRCLSPHRRMAENLVSTRDSGTLVFSHGKRRSASEYGQIGPTNTETLACEIG